MLRNPYYIGVTMIRQYLTFTLEDSQYAVEVAQVQEVLEYSTVTKVPCVASYMEGLIDSRGQGIPVVNLRKKIGMESVDINRDTRIIVMEIASGENTVVFGAIADSVQEVIDLDDIEIEPSPKFGNTIGAQFIKGIGKRDNKFIIILEVDTIFSTDEIITLEASTSMISEM